MSWLSEHWKQNATPEEFYDMLAGCEPLTFLERAKLFIEYAPPGASLFLGAIVRRDTNKGSVHEKENHQ